MDLLFIIYKHTCSINGKSYIGQTNDYDYRTWSHQRPYSRCPAFRNAIQKYGWSAFTSEILKTDLTQDQANELEEQLILTHNTLAPNGYNLVPGGKNHSHTEETRLKLSQRQKRPISDETRAKLVIARNKRPPLSEETKLKISLSCIGKPKSEETKLKMRKPKIGYTRKEVPIIQLDLNGNEIARYSSPKEAKTKTGIKYLGNCLAGRSKTAGGYCWIYAQQ